MHETLTPHDWVAHLSKRLSTLRPDIPEGVRLIAVTKTFPAAAVAAAYSLGLRDFGESKVQETEQKQQQLSDLKDITWHLIGHLQTNKARKAVQLYDWIHSVDSLKIAKKLNQAAADLDRRPYCCLQVKILPDPDKYGFEPDALLTALPELGQLSSLKIVGLMAILPFGLTAAQSQTAFEQVRILANRVNQMSVSSLQIDYLSMGMSGDFRSAIAAGATFIRLGTILFGQRQ
ncbi:MAG: YggS family pyridoxal phosphate-dependent enzyme [Cyanobacteria bacterium J06632_22]